MIVANPRAAARPTMRSPKAMPVTAAKPARRPLEMLRIARYPIFGPGVDSMIAQVIAKVAIVGSETNILLPVFARCPYHGGGGEGL